MDGIKRTILLVGLLCLLLTGCGNADEYRVSTVVYIPVSPTEAPVQPEQTLPPETQTEAETVPPTEETLPEETETAPEETEEVPETTEPEKKKGSTKKKNPQKQTEPPATEPAETEAPATEPVATEAPSTEPPVTEPSETEPEATDAPDTEPEPTEPELYDISGYSLGSLEKNMAAAINAHRAEAGLGELNLSSRLSAIASCRGYEISRVWSHTRPDGRGYGTVLGDYGYGGSARELLDYVSGSGDAQSIVDKWMASESHRELLLGNFSTIGIGIYRSNGYTYIACLLVG